MKILILKPSSLGDVVQALPVLRLLKRHRPESQIYWWVDLERLPLLEGDPDLTGLIPFDRRRWGRPYWWPALWRSVRRLRSLRFDWVIDLQSLARSGVMAWLANGEFTLGLDDAREGARGFYDVIVPRPSWHTHAVDWYLETLRTLEVPVHWDFEWLPRRAEVGAAVENKWQPARHAGRWVLLQPGARWPTKRWPVEHFAAVVRTLAARDPHLRFGVLGGPADRGLGDLLVQAAPGAVLNLAGQTTLPEMVEWLRLGRLLITNDTGPMHVAAALGRPLLALFGPTEPRRTGPYGQLEHVLQQRELPCVPCLASHCSYAKPLECLRSIPPQRVTELAWRLLGD